MKRFRWALFAVLLLGSLVLAYFLRDLIYELVIVPLAYTLWWGGLIYQAVPQLVKWIVLLVTLAIVVIWRLIPDLEVAPQVKQPRRRIEGRMETLVVGIARARSSNYFKWQLANRLGRLARRMSESPRSTPGSDSPVDAVQRYLAAGLNQSFVDFPTPRGPFSPRRPTALDVDPAEVIAYLESRMEQSYAGRSRSL